MSDQVNESNADQGAKIFQEQIKVKMYLQEQGWMRERDMILLNNNRKLSLLKHYIETIDVAIKHIKEVEGLD